MKIFDMDGPLYKIGNEIADVLILSLLWFVCSIPVVTIGAASSAVFYIYGKKVRNEDVYVMKDFFKSFKMNFLQSIPISILLGIMWISATAYRIILMGNGEAPSVFLTGVALFFTLEAVIMTVYVLAVLSRFHTKVPQTFLMAFVLGHRHIVSTGMIVALIIAIQYGSMAFPVLIFFSPVLIIALASIPIQKVFSKHITATEAAKEAKEEHTEEILHTTEDTQEEESEEDETYLKYL